MRDERKYDHKEREMRAENVEFKKISIKRFLT
jgi:hypothetical protein